MPKKKKNQRESCLLTLSPKANNQELEAWQHDKLGKSMDPNLNLTLMLTSQLEVTIWSLGSICRVTEHSSLSGSSQHAGMLLQTLTKAVFEPSETVIF